MANIGPQKPKGPKARCDSGRAEGSSRKVSVALRSTLQGFRVVSQPLQDLINFSAAHATKNAQGTNPCRCAALPTFALHGYVAMASLSAVMFGHVC